MFHVLMLDSEEVILFIFINIPRKQVTTFVFYDIPGSRFSGWYLICFQKHSRLLANHLFYQ